MASHFNPFGPGYSLMPPYYTVGENGQRLIPPANYIRGLQGFPPHRPELNTNFLEFDDPSRPVLPAQGSQRVRRRVGASGEHVKFRRTRSGCYTCRTRRVKCDEARPICERCRKGNRDCIYPEQSSSSKPRRGSTKGKGGEGEGSSQEDESDAPDTAILQDDEDLPTADSGEPPSATSIKSGSPSREPSDPPSLTHDKSPTPSTEGSASLDAHPQTTARRPDGRSQSVQLTSNTKWPQLPQDVRYYLQYARNKLTPYHWGFKFYEAQFLRTTLLEVAVRFEPLLYAVVGFAAYHRTLTKTNGKLHDFLDYYNKSVTLLRQSLKKNEKHTIATLLTILQLATIEEYLGDWINCMGHQRAAYQILTELYTPQTIVENESLRTALQWYIHFDVFAGLISGNGTVLGREWFQTQHDWDSQQVQQKPDDINLKYRECFSRFRVLAADMAIMFAKKNKNAISEEEFEAKCQEAGEELENWEERLDPALKNPSKFITVFPGARDRDPVDIVDPYDPQTLYGDELFPTNHLILAFAGLHLMFLYQLSEMQGKPRMPKMQEIALRMCQIIEAVQSYPGSPPSILIGVQANLGIATAFLPQDELHIMWARRKLAEVEKLGYVYPATFRMRMAQAWNVDVSDWWLPNGEGQPSIIRHIREFIADRAIAPRDAKEEDVLEMRGVFNTLNLSSSSSPESYHGPSREPAPHLRRTASDPAPTGKQSSLNLASLNSGATAAGMDDEAMGYGNSPEFAWGYEQQSWEGF